MQFVDFSLGAYTQNDQSASADILKLVQKGDLLIRDLGYFSLPVFAKLIAAEVDFLSRLRFGVKRSDYWGRDIALKALLKKAGKVDRWVWIGASDSVWVRVVMLPLPRQQNGYAGPKPTGTSGSTTAKNTTSGSAIMFLLPPWTRTSGAVLR
jgi:hypothetical protein